MKKILPSTSNTSTETKGLNPKGFTLIELLVVIAIIAILAVIGLTVFGGQQANARNARRRSDIAAIGAALESHHDNTNAACTGQVGLNAGAHYCGPAATWFSGGIIPVDPFNNVGGGITYQYQYSVNGGAFTTVVPTAATPFTTYTVEASLEASGAIVAGTLVTVSNQQS